MAEYFTIYSEKIEGRLDPLYYSQDIFALLKKSQYKIKTLGEVVLYLKTGFPAGASQQEFDDTGIIQIRPTNIDEDGLLKFNRNIYVKHEYLDEKKGDLLIRGEVLFNNTNSQELVGKSVFFDMEGRYFCSNHVTRIKVKDGLILPKYLWILLNLYQERKIFYSLCTNWNNQSGVNAELLKTVRIPIPDLKLQKQIVEHVEKSFLQKKQKNAEAQKLLNSIDDCVANKLGINMPSKRNRKSFVITSNEIKANRLDPYYYQEEFIALINALSKIKYKIFALGDLITDISGGATPRVEDDYYTDSASGIPFLRVQNIAKEGLVLEDVKYITKAVHNGMLKRSQLNAGNLVFTITGRIGSVAVIPEGFEGNINQHSVRIHLKDKIDGIRINPSYVAAYLNSRIGNRLSNRGITGGTRPALDYEYIKSIKIPMPPIEIQNEIANEVKKLVSETQKLEISAKEIIKQAKQEAEELILRK